MKDDSVFSVYINKAFYKVDEGYKILGNQTFEIRGIESDIKVDGLNIKKEYDGIYICQNGIKSNYGELGHLLPKVLIERLEQVETKNDVISLINEVGSPSNSSYQFIHLSLPIKIKQTTTQEGFITNDLVYILNGSINFDYDEFDNIINMKFNFAGDYYNQTFRVENFNDINSWDDYIKIENTEWGELDDENTTCINQSSADGKIITDVISSDCNNGLRDSQTGFYWLVHYFVDYQGEAKLEISNTVNGLSEYNAQNNKELNYEITLMNSGDVSSWNNVVVTSIPEEIIVNEDSISDDGDYDKSDDSITWKIDELEAGENYTLSYSATVSENADKSKTYIGKSKVFSNQSKVVHSKETKVYLSKSAEVIDRNNLVNPNTYSTAVFGIVTVVLICLVIGTYFVKMKND